MESSHFFGRQLPMTIDPLYKTFFIFDLGPLMPKIYPAMKFGLGARSSRLLACSTGLCWFPASDATPVGNTLKVREIFV